MLKHGISYGPYCRRPFCYARSYDRHLALKHATNRTANNRAAFWITSTTRDSEEDSDYEDPGDGCNGEDRPRYTTDV